MGLGDLTWLPQLVNSPAQFVVGVLFGWLVYRPLVRRAQQREDRATGAVDRLVPVVADLADQVRMLLDARDGYGTGRHRRDG